MTVALLEMAVGHRHGLVPPPVRIPATPADLDEIHNWSVPYPGDDPWRSAGGGVGRTRAVARSAAIAEALERYAAVSYKLPLFDRSGQPTTAPSYPSPLGGSRHQRSGPAERLAFTPTELLELHDFTLFSPEQQLRPDFPHRRTFQENVPLTDVYRLRTNSAVLAPAALVGLTDAYGALPTSSGLAAAPTVEHALLRAVQELVERDAYMAIWLHGLVPPRIRLGSSLEDPVAQRGGWVAAFDITPSYSSHSVAVVVGDLPMAGAPRVSLGIACRASWHEAVDKAYLEWSQGVIFAGHRARREPDLQFASANDVRDFDDHAVYYTVHPDRWEHLPIFQRSGPVLDGPDVTQGSDDESAGALTQHLEEHGIRLYYRDLTLIDLAQIGLRVVRVLSPELTPIHSDHRWPHLGGTTADVTRRYPWANVQKTNFPSPHPHALG